MYKNWPVIVLAVALIAIVCVSGYTDPSNNERQTGANANSPASNIAHNEGAQASNDAHRPERAPFWRKLVAWPDGVAALAILFTLFFIAWQAMLMRQSLTGADDSSKRELRAYLNVVIGEAIWQERRPPAVGGDLMFEGRPLLINTGRTPAKNIIFKARAAVLPAPLPRSTRLPEEPDIEIPPSMLGSQQSASMFAIVDGFRPDDEVDIIKSGHGNIGLYVWGKITYDDDFGDPHFFRFCQQLYWDGSGKLRCFYTPGRNEAD